MKLDERATCAWAAAMGLLPGVERKSYMMEDLFLFTDGSFIELG